jgi:hypothetical protein
LRNRRLLQRRFRSISSGHAPYPTHPNINEGGLGLSLRLSICPIDQLAQAPQTVVRDPRIGTVALAQRHDIADTGAGKTVSNASTQLVWIHSSRRNLIRYFLCYSTEVPDWPDDDTTAHRVVARIETVRRIDHC